MDFPLIGVSGSLEKDESKSFVPSAYFRCLLRAGGVPALLSPDMGVAEIQTCASKLDGLLLTGGNDINPALFCQAPRWELGEVNPLRDQAELAMIRAFIAAGKPILGVCRGIQILNVALGGSLYQDLRTQYPEDRKSPAIGHQQTSPGQYPSHKANVCKGSLLERLAGQEEIQVNSMHHQAVWTLGKGLRVSARAEDEVIEAVEGDSSTFLLGVQWHPERLPETDPVSGRIFKGFVQAAQNKRR